jgi:DNA polymerase
MTRSDDAEDLYARVRGCTKCPLSRTRTCAVPGEGPLDAEIMLIGEAPGANEDQQGRPFVGAAGKFLEELLAAAGLKREDVYICNVLKCRPPANRDPMPGEIEACRDFLDEQIDIIDPLVIVTLGRYSMARFFPNQSISRIHGRPRETAGRFYVPMYHPAAALHQQSLRQVMLRDFEQLPALVAKARPVTAAAAGPQQGFDFTASGLSADRPTVTSSPPPGPSEQTGPQGQIRLFE